MNYMNSPHTTISQKGSISWNYIYLYELYQQPTHNHHSERLHLVELYIYIYELYQQPTHNHLSERLHLVERPLDDPAEPLRVDEYRRVP